MKLYRTDQLLELINKLSKQKEYTSCVSYENGIRQFLLLIRVTKDCSCAEERVNLLLRLKQKNRICGLGKPRRE